MNWKDFGNLELQLVADGPCWHRSRPTFGGMRRRVGPWFRCLVGLALVVHADTVQPSPAGPAADGSGWAGTARRKLFVVGGGSVLLSLQLMRARSLWDDADKIVYSDTLSTTEQRLEIAAAVRWSWHGCASAT